MRLVEIIRTITWLELEPEYLRLYPDDESAIEEYERIYTSLLQITPSETNMRISIEYVDEEGDQYHHVHGISNPEGESSVQESWALDFADWSEWLDMKIESQTLVEYTPVEIATHCLWEMTFAGFSREEIRERLDELISQVEEIKKEHGLDSTDDD